MTGWFGDAARSFGRAITILACVAFGLAPRWVQSAPAEEDFAVVSDLVLNGDVMDDHWQLQFEGALTRGLERAGFSHVLPAAENCEDSSCLRQQAREANATAVVHASIVVRDRFYTVRLEAFDPVSAAGTTAAALAVVEEECPICGPGEVAALLERTATVLGRKLPKDQAPGQLLVRSFPVGASIVLDGKTVGVSPMDIDLAPGQHKLVVSAPGYITRERATASVSKVRETWAPVLQRLEPVRTPRQRRLAAGGWTATGAGAGAGIAAIVFLALDRRPVPSSCGASMLDADGDCRRIYQTSTHGAIMLGTTIALVVTGALLLSRSRKATAAGRHSRRRSTRARARALPQPAAAFGW